MGARPPAAWSTSGAWESSAKEYDAFERRWHYYARVAEELVRPLRIGKGSRVLELASGTGACTEVIARRCSDGEVVCVERSEEMLKLARANLEAAGLSNVAFLWSEVARLDELLANETPFDFAVCNSAFWQLPEVKGVLQSLNRSLKPGGLFAFNIPQLWRSERARVAYRDAVEEILERHSVDPSRFWPRGRDPLDWRALLESAGFELKVETHYEVEMRAKEREAWRRIPIFAQRRDRFGTLPPSVRKEIRKEVTERRQSLWRSNSTGRNRWRLLVARARSVKGRRPARL